MNLTIKRLANYFGDKKREQIYTLKNERDVKIKALRDVYLDELGLLAFYEEHQGLVNAMKAEHDELIADAHEKNLIEVTSYSGLAYYLRNIAGDDQLKDLDRLKVRLDSQAYRDELDLLEAPIEAVEIEWDKLIGNIKARTTVKKALAYLHEIGIDTTEVEEKFAKKEVEALPPATIINLNMLALKKEDVN